MNTLGFVEDSYCLFWCAQLVTYIINSSCLILEIDLKVILVCITNILFLDTGLVTHALFSYIAYTQIWLFVLDSFLDEYSCIRPFNDMGNRECKQNN